MIVKKEWKSQYQSTTYKLTYEPTNLLTYECTDLRTYWPTNLLTYETTDLPTYLTTDLRTYYPADLLTYEPTDLLTYEPTALRPYRPTKLQTVNVVSSAKLQTWVPTSRKNRSLMYILKRSGPRTDPWGTPHSSCSQLLKEVLTFVLCHLSER